MTELDTVPSNVTKLGKGRVEGIGMREFNVLLLQFSQVFSSILITYAHKTQKEWLRMDINIHYLFKLAHIRAINQLGSFDRRGRMHR